jgi:tryptophanyl-tRNA synthetase
MDLVDPTRKMGKSSASLAGVIALLDPPRVVERKIARATTDALGEVRYAPAEQPGVSNLLAMLGALTATDPTRVAESYDSYAALKGDVTAALIALLEPLQRRYAQVRSTGELDAVLGDGAVRAREIAGPTVDRARRAMGLAPAA